MSTRIAKMGHLELSPGTGRHPFEILYLRYGHAKVKITNEITINQGQRIAIKVVVGPYQPQVILKYVALIKTSEKVKTF